MKGVESQVVAGDSSQIVKFGGTSLTCICPCVCNFYFPFSSHFSLMQTKVELNVPFWRTVVIVCKTIGKCCIATVLWNWDNFYAYMFLFFIPTQIHSSLGNLVVPHFAHKHIHVIRHPIITAYYRRAILGLSQPSCSWTRAYFFLIFLVQATRALNYYYL